MKLLPLLAFFASALASYASDCVVSTPSPGERQAIISGHGLAVRWSMRVMVPPKHTLIFTRATKPISGRRFEEDVGSYIAIGEADLSTAQWILEKAVRWLAASAESKPPKFEKEIGRVGDSRWVFRWGGSVGTSNVWGGTMTLFDEEPIGFLQLLNEAPAAIAEFDEQSQHAKDFQDTLK